MKSFSILTPLYNPPAHCTGCLLSVYDQTAALHGLNMGVEHFLQNGGDPRTVEEKAETFQHPQTESPSGYALRLCSEADSGMYDALNRAFAATEGELVGHLNADEQYLPGTLAEVAEIFDSNPDVDAVTGAAIIVDANGDYVCTRPAVKPSLPQLEFCYLTLFTCATFFRRESLNKLGAYYDPACRYRGDAELVSRMLRHSFRFHFVPHPLSVFVDDGNNLALSPEAAAEKEQMQRISGFPAAAIESLLSARIKLKLWKAFQHMKHPFDYRWIQPDGTGKLVQVTRPSLKWPARSIRMEREDPLSTAVPCRGKSSEETVNVDRDGRG